MELLIAGKAMDLARALPLARELGHREILILFLSHEKEGRQAVEALRAAHPKLKLLSGLLVKDQSQASALRRHYDAIVAPAGREFFESRAVTHILNAEDQRRPDFMHHRNSGVSQVDLALAKRRGIAILAGLSQLFDAKRPEVTLGRMMQNARWCRKYKVPYELVSGARTIWEQRAAEDLKALRRELLSS